MNLRLPRLIVRPMRLLDLLIEGSRPILIGADPSDLKRALGRRLVEIDPAAHDAPMPEHEKLARVRLAQKFERVVRH